MTQVFQGTSFSVVRNGSDLELHRHKDGVTLSVDVTGFSVPSRDGIAVCAEGVDFRASVMVAYGPVGSDVASVHLTIRESEVGAAVARGVFVAVWAGEGLRAEAVAPQFVLGMRDGSTRVVAYGALHHGFDPDSGRVLA